MQWVHGHLGPSGFTGTLLACTAARSHPSALKTTAAVRAMSHPSQQTCLIPWALKTTAVYTHSCALLAPALPLVARAAHAMPVPGGIGATLAAAAVGAQQRRCRLATRRHEGPRFSRTQKVRNGGSWAVDPLLPGLPPWPLSLLRTRGNCSCGAPLRAGRAAPGPLGSPRPSGTSSCQGPQVDL